MSSDEPLVPGGRYDADDEPAPVRRHGRASHSGQGSSAHGSLAHLSRAARWLPLAVMGALAAVVLLGAFFLVRRPADIEEQMPLASEQDPPVTTTASPQDATPDHEPAEPPLAPGPMVIHVAGAVASPGVVELVGPARVVDAVRAAGGLRADADPDRVNLAAPLIDGQRIVIPVIGQEPPAELTQPSPVPESRPSAAAPGDAAGAAGESGDAETVDVNTADAGELERLAGVGPATAAAIIAHRDEHGPFTSAEGLIDVRGIGEAKLDAMRDMVSIGGS